MISIVIPTYNGQSTIRELLDSLRKQTVLVDEIIVLDSESADATLEIAVKANCRASTVLKNNFDHGATRNIGIEQAKGEFVIFLTQDVLPCDEYTIENIIKPFMEDMQIGAAFGRQMPYPNASIFAEHLRLFNYPDTSYIRTLEDRKKYGIKTAFLSNSFAAYRRSALEKIGYFKSGLIFGEDTCAAADMLLKKQKIAYAADAKVFHSHNYTIYQDFRRYFDMGVFHRNENWLLREFGKAEGQGLKYIKSEIAFLMKRKRFDLFPEFLPRILAKYLGYKLGGQYLYLPRCVNKKFSINRQWWNKVTVLNQHSVSDH